MKPRMPIVVIALCFGLACSALSQEYILLGWNDLGMHCANKSFAKVAVLPPYNNVHAQLLLKQPGMPPQVVTSGYTVEYSIPNNTHSVGKTDFWTYAQQLFGLPSPLPNNIGLTGNGLTGTMVVNGIMFEATGIPVTPFPDSTLVTESPFQLIHLVAKNAITDSVLATTDAVIPVSNEVGCVQSGCHSSETAILNSHEDVSGFNHNGPVLCASCHASNALGTPGIPEAMPFSYRIHSMHASVAGPSNAISTCYKCHPGPNTQCLRDIMGKNPVNPLVCQNCHGTMQNVASTILSGRRPWLDEPQCGSSSCHGSNYAEETGKLFRMSKGHGGMACESCHGSPHAIQPTVQPNDNLQNTRLQGFAGALRKCSACHGDVPTGPGPHGIMDTLSTPLVPSLLAPPNFAVGTNVTPTLSWSAASFAQTYGVQIARDSLFSTIVLSESLIASTSLMPPPLDTSSQYFWRVRSMNSNGSSAWSATWSFTTSSMRPTTPILSSPPNNATGTSINPTFYWTSVLFAQSYAIQIARDSLFSSIVLSESLITSTSYTAASLDTSQRYFWRVRSTNAYATSSWSDVWSLTTSSGMTISFIVDTRWNLISVPAFADNLSVDVLFPGATTQAFFFDQGSGYVGVSSMSPGIGYWLKFATGHTANVTGRPIADDTVQVTTGWNLISGISYPILVSSIVQDPGGIVASNFIGFRSGYVPVSSILPGHATWVKVNQSGKLILRAP